MTLNQGLPDEVALGNRIASDGVFTYLHDAEGNIIRRTNIADGSYTNYIYDYRQRITGVWSYTAGGVNTSFTQYRHDAYDRLVRIKHDPDGAGTGVGVNQTFLVHDGTDILFQFAGKTTEDLANRYLHADAVDRVLADEKLTTGRTHWMLTDHLGTIRQMVNFAYGAWQGARFGMQRAYNAFGQILAQGQPFDTIFAYTGQLLDKPTAMQYHQHRWYNPGIGRWMSEDPTGLGPDVNLARYVGNSSTMLVDPSGLEPPRMQLWNVEAVFDGGQLVRVNSADMPKYRTDSHWHREAIERDVYNESLRREPSEFYRLLPERDPCGGSNSFAHLSHPEGSQEPKSGPISLQMALSDARISTAEAQRLEFTDQELRAVLGDQYHEGSSHAVNRRRARLAALMDSKKTIEVHARIWQPTADLITIIGGLPLAAGAPLRRAAISPLRTPSCTGVVDEFRRVPNSLSEKLAMDEAMGGAGKKVMDGLGDPRFKGMDKWQHVHRNSDGTITVIHYVRAPVTGKLMDFKFK